MEKEKIVLGNGTELSYDSIGFNAGCLVIGFVGGDVATLEQAFRTAGQTNLETISQQDEKGNEMNVFERYDIFKAINKQIGATAEEDVVEVVLGQESETDMKIRHLEERMASNEEVTDALLMSELA